MIRLMLDAYAQDAKRSLAIKYLECAPPLAHLLGLFCMSTIKYNDTQANQMIHLGRHADLQTEKVKRLRPDSEKSHRTDS